MQTLIVDRLSMFFGLVFMGFFTHRRFSKFKTVTILVCVFLLSSAIELFLYLDTALYKPLIVEPIGIALVIITSYIISRLNGFRPLFVALFAVTYVLMGASFYTMSVANGHSIFTSAGVLIIVNTIVLAISEVTFGRNLMRDLDTPGYRWRYMCIVPVCYFFTQIALNRWPQSIADHPEAMPGVVFLHITMIVTVIIMASFMSRENEKNAMYAAMLRIGDKSENAYRSKIVDNSALRLGFRLMILAFAYIVVLGSYYIGENYYKNLKDYRAEIVNGTANMAGLDVSIVYEPLYEGLHREDDHDNPDGLHLDSYIAIATLTNTSNRAVSDWAMYLDVKDDIYLNRAWSGSAEVHQLINGRQEIQIFENLRDLTPERVRISHINTDDGVYIYLQKGSRIIYRPAHSLEDPIESNDYVTPGFIIFCPRGENPDFFDGYITYKMRLKITDHEGFRVLLAVAAVWGICFMFLWGYYIRSRFFEKRQIQDRKMVAEVMSVFTAKIDSMEGTTKGHSERVAKYTQGIASHMGFSEEEQIRIYYCAKLHDCGKVGVPKELLNKSEVLGPDEVETVRNHTIIGYDMLKSLSTLPNAAIVARYHHERYDGMGYPEHLAGENIPLIVRIVSVANAFDNMNIDRIAQEREDHDYIIEEFKKEKGKRFDPDIVDIFTKMLERGEVKFEV